MTVIVVMGVSGAGKTAVGNALARRLGYDFVEGDDYHPPANLDKMSRGEALDDDDRRGWLEALAAAIGDWRAAGCDVVLSCSALKRSYREMLGRGVRVVYLRGDEELIRRRLAARRGHFMPPGLLASQLAALEEPADALTIDITEDPETLAAALAAKLEG